MYSVEKMRELIPRLLYWGQGGGGTVPRLLYWGQGGLYLDYLWQGTLTQYKAAGQYRLDLSYSACHQDLKLSDSSLSGSGSAARSPCTPL